MLSKTQSISEVKTDVEMFKEITQSMSDLYAKKNENYGNSFAELYEDLGPIAGLVPLCNKLNRIKRMVKGKKSDFESLEDSLIDLANYTIMNLIELKKQKELENINKELVREVH